MADWPKHPFLCVAIWAVLALLLVVPIGFAAGSPLLQWRVGIYILAGFSGVAAMSLLLLQPLLAGGYLPGVSSAQARRLHRWIGCSLVVLVIVHVGGLWVTSPPDVVDALLFRSPTVFSYFGVIAMWAVFASALLVTLRTRLSFALWGWQQIHTGLAVVIVIGSVVHALLIVGTMEMITKSLLCLAVVIALLVILVKRRRWGRQSHMIRRR
ncbi:ferric reductase-like transmembrane domain-containing protein [Roseibium limicola]|uniref:ferric reductase-like transmembrane domain-containing protein n=1 Tax=Roseibium limicola TaxID=2816037 RepID=UPI001E5A4FAD|nr:ferric reductase-like transmembrane domain-containing protein [Roseibium limicola]